MHSCDPAEPGDCASKCFYAYENAIVAVAFAVGEKWEKNHAKKRRLAKALCGAGILATDISDRLEKLNQLRKDVAYSEPGWELAQLNLDDLVNELDAFLSEVEVIIDAQT